MEQNKFINVIDVSANIVSGFITKEKKKPSDEIEKATVKAHTRKTKSGKLSQVKQYEDKRKKKDSFSNAVMKKIAYHKKQEAHHHNKMKEYAKKYKEAYSNLSEVPTQKELDRVDNFSALNNLHDVMQNRHNDLANGYQKFMNELKYEHERISRNAKDIDKRSSEVNSGSKKRIIVSKDKGIKSGRRKKEKVIMDTKDHAGLNLELFEKEYGEKNFNNFEKVALISVDRWGNRSDANVEKIHSALFGANGNSKFSNKKIISNLPKKFQKYFNGNVDKTKVIGKLIDMYGEQGQDY